MLRPLLNKLVSGASTSHIPRLTAKASSTAVLPAPFSPTSNVNCGCSIKVCSVNLLKFCTVSWSILIPASRQILFRVFVYGNSARYRRSNKGSTALLDESDCAFCRFAQGNQLGSLLRNVSDDGALFGEWRNWNSQVAKNFCV